MNKKTKITGLSLLLSLMLVSWVGADCINDCNKLNENMFGQCVERCQQSSDILKNNECPENMALIHAGRFEMGCSSLDDDCAYFEKPTFKAIITQDYCMDIFEFPNSKGQIPKTNVSWNDAKMICEAQGKRLPSEAEWEYAARAGTQTRYVWGYSIQSWKVDYCDVNCEYRYKDTSTNDGYSRIAPAGSYEPNNWGLFDMSGNVSEWVSDCFTHNGYEQVQSFNPRIICSDKELRVVRGGSWKSEEFSIRLSARYWYKLDEVNDMTGFRCVSDLKKAE